MCFIKKPHSLEYLICLIASWCSSDLDHEVDIFADTQMIQELKRLKNQRDRSSTKIRKCISSERGNIFLREEYLSLTGFFESSEEREERGFADATRTHKRDKIS